MKKIALLSLLAAAVAMPATVASVDVFAKDEAAATHATAAPAAGGTRKELKDGSWAQISGDSVKVSKDGKTWTDAPDGTHEAKDGSTITTKGGKTAH